MSGARQLWLFAAAATAEIGLITFLFDSPRIDQIDWLDPIQYVNAIAKVAIVAFCILLVTAWPRRREIVAAHEVARERSGVANYVLGNVALFIALIAVRIAIDQVPNAPPALLALYCFLLLATGVSLAFLAAPPAFWWRLPRIAPLEIALAMAGGVVALGLGRIATEGWAPLASATLSVSYWILTLYEPNVVLDTQKWLLGAKDFSVLIYGPCSGYEGMSLFLVLMSIYVWVFRRELRFPNVLILLPLGMAFIWILNAVRIAVLVSIGAHVSPDIAVQGFHSQAGWISFLFVTLGIVAVTRRVPMFVAQTAAPSISAKTAKPAGDLTLAFLAPFMALLVSNLFASAFAPHEHGMYGVRVVAVGATLWWFKDAYKPLLAGFSWSSVAVGLAIGVAWIATDPKAGQSTPLGEWLVTLPVWTAAAWLALRAIGTVALVPIAEELAFRGFLARWLVSTRFDAVSFGQFSVLAFVVSSLAFGIMHQRWLAAALAGAAYALLMYRTRRLSDPIAAHATTNLAIVLWAIAAEQWSLL